MPPININVFFLHGARDWEWLWHGPRAFRISGGFVLSYRWFALGLVLDVALGGGFVFAYRWSALGLVSDVVFGGGFVLSYRWFALGVSFGRYVWRRFRPILSFALCVGFGRSFWRRFRLILSLVRLRCRF